MSETPGNPDERPRALISAEGRFHSLAEPGAIEADGEYRHPEPPESLPPPWPEPINGKPEAASPAEVYLTIDAEDDYFTVPHMLTGEGLGEEYGAYGILDILERHGLAATFFVNVYEAHRHQDPTVFERLVKAIHERGHEVALHTHPSDDLDFYSRPLFWFSAEEQKGILGYGAELIEKWTGEHPVSFRAGGYALNDATFEALESLGFRVDSSVFFTSPNNRITPFTVNAVRMRGGLVEVPVTYVARAIDEDALEHRKFDLNWLSPDELDRVVDRLCEFGLGQAMFMMHSFSFIDKASIKEGEPGTSRALYRSPPVRTRYVEVYGTKPDLREAFDRFAGRLAQDRRIEVKTLAAAADGLVERARRPQPDLIPVV